MSGSIANGTNHNGNGSQAGGDSQTPGGEQPAGPGGQQPGGGGGGNAAQAPTALPTESACSAPGSPGPRVMRRLTAGEFAASITDLFGDKSVPIAQVFNDTRVLGFTVDSDTLLVQDLNADQLMTNAEAVANWAVTAQLEQLKQLATCSTHDANCAKLFIKNFGRKAFRSAIADGDARIKSYSDLFMAEADFATGVSTVISAMLQSPYFLYRSEIGPVGASGTVTLTPYEVASSLSYLLTGTTPDDTLLKAADAVTTNSADALAKMVDEQATRLLAPSGEDPLPPAAQDALMNFMSGWLGLDRLYTNVKDDKVLMLKDTDRADMAMETRKFILDIWGASTGNTVGDLFGANYTFLNQNLANFYGLNQSATSSTFSKVTLPSGRDPGILGQASILIGYARADLSSPTQRGHLVRSRILCQDVLPPPAGLDTKFTPNANLKTTRDQYLQGHAAPDHQPCYGCHKIMDPIGVAFEHYDAFGRYRTTENGVNIDATGTIYEASAKDGDVAIDGLSGAQGLQTYLAKSDDVKTCLVRYWSYYAFGSASWPQDGCTYQAIRTEAASKSYSLKSVLTAIIHSPRFTTRVMDQ
ncbi:MAG TPA: DUF1588 domain-containing protein [Polyangiaceae bacterium]|nr:DUF1588 domain-containing protein [Polyangiaceae bacterium]